MYIRLIRNQSQGSAITGRLVINGRWFCNTLERVGYQIPALCYRIAVTQSPKFRRLLPIVQNVPQRSGIRFHRGSKPEHSTGCILVVADNINDNTDNLQSTPKSRLFRGPRGNQFPAAPKENIPCRSRDILISPDGSNDRSAYDSSGNNRSNECEIRMLSKLSSNNNSSLSSNKKNIGGRSAADVEQSLTQLLLQTQETHEEIILEVIDFRPGTDYGYDTPCPSSECACEKEIRAANFARRHPSSILEPPRLSDDC